MTRALFFDTETSGLPLFNEPSEDPRQPHIVQIGALLADLDTGKVISSLDLIIRPDGWEIPEDVAKIHGITTERARDVGISESVAVDALIELWARADLRVGHNESFDARIVRIALFRHVAGLNCAPTLPDEWKAGKAECTQRMATPLLKLPPTEKMRAAGRFHYKSANLSEAYKHFTGQDLEDAHSAMADARACMAVYLAIRALAPVAA